jgi:pilus assembly protein CpaD
VVLALGLALAGCSTGPHNRSVESIHQPVISHNSFALDLYGGPDGLAPGEPQRLAGWFDGMALRYGDKVSVVAPAPSSRAAVAGVAMRYGIELAADLPANAGAGLRGGAVRVVVTRAAAVVPRCPDWSSNGETNFRNANSSNFGCATNGTLAAMVANPDDLLHGNAAPDLKTTTASDKAIDAYRTAKPTGTGGLAKSNGN